MPNLDNYLNAFRYDCPEKREFKGNKKDAVDKDNKLTDLNSDGKINISDALDDGVLTQKEYKALKDAYKVDQNNISSFNKALDSFLLGTIPASGISFVEKIETLDSENNNELRLSGKNKNSGFEKAELITGNINLKITDRDGIDTDSREDTDISLVGETNLESPLPKDFKLPPGVNVSAKNGSISLDILGFELMNLKVEKNGKDTDIVISPPGKKLTDMATTLGIGLPLINEKTIAKIFGVVPELVRQVGQTYHISGMELLEAKTPDGIELAGKKLNLNSLDLSGLYVKKVELKNGSLNMRIQFNDAKINAGSGTAKTEGKLNQTLEFNMSVGNIKIGEKDSPFDSIKFGTLKLENITEEIKKQIISLGGDNIKDVNIEWKNDEMLVSAKPVTGSDKIDKIANSVLKAKIPVTLNGEEITIDLSGIKVLGIPALNTAERLGQLLANTEKLNSKVVGSKISFNINELLLKGGVGEAKDYKIQTTSIDNGKLYVGFSKTPQNESDFKPAPFQKPVYNENIVSPFIGLDTKGNGIFGVGYTNSAPIGSSPLGKLLKLDPSLGKIPNLSYSYLDNTLNASASISTDGSFRTEVSTGIKASGNPAGLPVFIQADVLGLGIKANKDGVSPYLPFKLGTGFDNGKFNAGLFYQHNFVLGQKDDNIFGVSTGVRW